MKNIIKIFSIFIIVSCKKEQKQPISIKTDLDNLFKIDNYQNVIKKKINDSVLIFEGKNERFSIKGQYNFVNNYKTGCWESYDNISKEKYLNVEFFKEDDKMKEFNNQIIFYKNNNVNLQSSKFYTKKYNPDNRVILYNFYCSKTVGSNYSAVVNIGIISGERPLLYPKDFECEKIADGRYQYSLDLSKYTNHSDLKIVGLFSEYSTDKKKNTLGIDQIFISDTIQLKQ
ncbi:hypothetical protein LF887_07150 [Chryseobacterium sp. MEBOG06]|uniref:hypothetical protein n=1 Tax=Chryseobacterium sp. MEBOG06 TaxID=2879938 RepID=UPI001F39965C|nr:hypothetical protein [Chryseobacterium sp. MEBOG06]UKB85392.1 hypothetical protein LF887_07150 [Chryseobacterium sp. MEBOG06]